MSKILLVEDDRALRDAYQFLLESQEKYDVSIAANGEEALAICKAQTFDLILLDLMMPVLDGVGFLQRANLKETAPATRIVILSNLSSGEQLQSAMQLGAHRNAVKSDLAPKDVLAVVDAELAQVNS